MNLLTIVLFAALAYVLYIMLSTYRSLERELREIRLKCMGRPESSQTAADPGVVAKTQLLETFRKAMAAVS